MRSILLSFVFGLIILSGCKKSDMSRSPSPASFSTTLQQVNGATNPNGIYNSIQGMPIISFSFSAAINRSTVANSVSIVDNTGALMSFTPSYQHNDSTLIVQPQSALKPLSIYLVTLSRSLQSVKDSALKGTVTITLNTTIDSSDKFPVITDSALLTLVEQQTFKYFWDFGHPVSGMARERNSSADVIATGGSGFGIMAMLVGVQRNFITRAQAFARLDTIVNFLTNKATRYHGAYAHWINGSTGATIPFGTQDDGADLVETSYLMQGLLTARQFFNSMTDAGEISLRNNINALWDGVDWGWFRQNNQNTLYWHWSPDYNWSTNQQINGWDEALITYVLAASANMDSIPKVVYDHGWAGNGSMKNGSSYFGIPLPLGPSYGGPLFFAHYSFLGINPNGLSDAYANYWTQDTAHAKINYTYCVHNPLNFTGYSSACWGLTASDDNISGYSAHSPTNDLGVISPTAAISSLPYTPAESMSAIKFFYYKLGDKIWGQYGFVDAFNLTNVWFANSFLAIDQGPEIVMIENYRSGLLWNLFMSCPEIKRGMTNLGFQGPNL